MKLSHLTWSILKPITFLLSFLAIAHGADSDFDGLDDAVETNTGVFVTPSNTGTNPSAADSDGDGVPDGLEVKEKTSPVDAMKFNSFSKGLAGYWGLDGSYSDTSGNQIDFVSKPSTAFAVGRKGESDGSLVFSNISGRAISAKSIDISGNQDRTIAFWCRLPQNSGSIAVGWGINEGTPSVPGTASSLWVNNEGRVGLWGAYADIEAINRINPKGWNHVVVSYTNNFSEAKISINGKIQSHFNGPLNTLNQLSTSNSVVTISGYAFNDISNQSNIDDVRIYRRALSELEIKNLYISEAPHFQIIQGSYTWHEAKVDAEARGGRLAVLNTPEKVNLAEIVIDISGRPGCWIGLADEVVENQWEWINGTPLNFAKWETGQPDNQNNEDYVHYWSGRLTWNDLRSIDESRMSYLIDFHSYNLKISTIEFGNVMGSSEYDPGASATITATPNPGYRFTGWTGDASGSDNPTTILMDSDKTVGATFVEDIRDSDNDGLSNHQELVTYGSNPELVDTDGDGLNDGVEVAQGRSPKTAEPVITNITATQRSGTKIVDISYDLSSLTPTVKVTLEISRDGGLTYNVPVTSTTGAIGDGVTVGTDKTIAWNAGVDWDGNFSNQMRFRLVADDLQVPGFSLIPSGSFTMGRTSGDTDANAPSVNVNVSQFYMGKYEVTKADWDEVRAWAVNNGYTDLAPGDGKANNHPIHSISWWDVIKWCNARSQKEGLIPCYTVNGAVMKTGTTDPTVSWTANGYRLPTEAEWEKAARGGVSGKRFPWGTDTISHENANFNNINGEIYQTGTTGYHPSYETGSTPFTSPVGSFAANGYSLHDMAGNVWEWCWDWHGASTYVNYATDPRGAASGPNRVLRGGGWSNYAIYCRAAERGYNPPSYSDYNGGFRVARSHSIMLGVSNASSAHNSTVDIRNFSLSKTTTTNGSISGNGSYLSGASVTATATPQAGYLFGSWTGDASGSDNPTTILMDSDKTVGATFVEDSRDPDNDGLTNYQEIIVRLTNPDLADSDSDGVNDGQEVSDGTNPLVSDSDGDGLSDGEEKTLTTHPLLTDTDGDSYTDSYEVQFATDPKLAISVPKFLLTLSNNGSALGGSFASTGSLAHGTNASVTATPLPGYLFGSWSGDASGSANPTIVLMDADKTVGATFVEDTRDPDNDGLTNYQEIIIRLTNPDFADSDSDGVNDGQEVTDATNPLLADTDTDGLTDGEEKTCGTNPLVADSDSDGVNDAQEVTDATNPHVADSDGDGLTDGEEKSRNTDPLTQDTDVDGVTDAQEVTDATNPLLADTDGDGLNDGQEKTRATNPLVTDSDSDGVNDGQEVSDGTIPLDADTDGDGLTDGEEKTMATNPLVADSDGDGLTDSEEKSRTTNPLAKDTDGDGLSDLEEELITKTNPLLADTDGDAISDALEDLDNDGISNLREVTELTTDPLRVDSDSNGLSDTYELVFKGSVAAFQPRIGDRLRFELRELVPQGTLRLAGTLPTGLTFNALTGVLEGKLTGRVGAVNLSIQVLNGSTVMRTIPFTFSVSPFPSGLIGTWQVLLEDANGSPQGLITTTVSSPGAWSARYDAIGTRTIRSTRGVFDLSPSLDQAAFAITFPVSTLTPAFSTSWQIDASTALASGTYAQGTLRGFRLAKIGELPTVARQVTMVIDQGKQDGFLIPAGLGWATGTLSKAGILPLSGQLGDAQVFRTSLSLGATGQAILWAKPYRNLNSFLGGIISLQETGVIPQTSFGSLTSGLLWQRVADSVELSYSSGFGPIAADATVNPYIKPATALALATNLGLTNNQFRNVTFDGGGLPNAEQFSALPERFVMDSSYKLNVVPLSGRIMALWQGAVNGSAGSYTGTIALDASNSGILKGNATVSGVIFGRENVDTVGAGLIKIPTTGVKGSFRTGALLMNR